MLFVLEHHPYFHPHIPLLSTQKWPLSVSLSSFSSLSPSPASCYSLILSTSPPPLSLFLPPAGHVLPLHLSLLLFILFLYIGAQFFKVREQYIKHIKIESLSCQTYNLRILCLALTVCNASLACFLLSKTTEKFTVLSLKLLLRLPVSVPFLCMKTFDITTPF